MIPPAALRESCESGPQEEVDGVEQSEKPVGPITDVIPVIRLMESKSPLKDIVNNEPFGPGAKY